MYQRIHELLQKPILGEAEARGVLKEWLQSLKGSADFQPVHRHEVSKWEENRFSGDTDEHQTVEHPFLREDLIVRGILLYKQDIPSSGHYVPPPPGNFRVGGGISTHCQEELYLLEDGGLLECKAATSWSSIHNPSEMTDIGSSSTRRKMVYHLIEALDAEEIESLAKKLSIGLSGKVEGAVSV